MTGAKIGAKIAATGARTAAMTAATGGMTARTGAAAPGYCGDSSMRARTSKPMALLPLSRAKRVHRTMPWSEHVTAAEVNALRVGGCAAIADQPRSLIRDLRPANELTMSDSRDPSDASEENTSPSPSKCHTHSQTTQHGTLAPLVAEPRVSCVGVAQGGIPWFGQFSL